MKYYLYPYKPFSTSAKHLARGLGIRRIKHENSKFRPSLSKTVINWGCSDLPQGVEQCIIRNVDLAVARASNKLDWFRNGTEDVRVPRWAEDLGMALDWGCPFMAREVLTGHSGQGMVYCEPGGTQYPGAPLYVEYIKKKQEYRVHIIRDGNQNSMFIQRKARKNDVPDDEINWKIRNHSNGFIYTNSDEGVGNVPDDVVTQAACAMENSGLDFGAVDVIWNEQRHKAYVLEINTAPGITGRTLEFYIDTFKKYYQA